MLNALVLCCICSGEWCFVLGGVASLVAQMVKNLPAMQERSRLDPWVRKIPWRRKWQPTPLFLPGEFHGERSLVATVHGVTNSWTPLSDSHFHFGCSIVECDSDTG